MKMGTRKMGMRKMASRMMLFFLLFLAMGICFPAPGQGASEDPAREAGSMRTLLTEALIALPHDGERALSLWDDALHLYEEHLAGSVVQADPAADEGIKEGFEQGNRAISAGDAALLAGARAKIWTGLLRGSYALVQQGILEGDGRQAEAWLKVREYRKTTRFSRPGADATLAVDRFVRGETSKEEALLHVQADLLDTYQARMQKSVQDLRDAYEKGFKTRMAEHFALLEGYF